MELTFRQKFKLTIRNGLKYMPLLRNLISRELKKKYRQNLLGYVWCILSPLMVMIIMTIVFSRMFHNSIDNFPVYLFSGRMMYSFITDCCGSMLRSIVENGRLMRKTRVPYYIFPLASMGGCVVNFLFQLIAFALVLIFTGTFPSYHIIIFPVVCLEMFLFSFGFGSLLAISQVYIRDTKYIYTVFTTAWFYLTALFYPLKSLSLVLQRLIRNFNPAYYFVEMSRDIFLYHQWPRPMMMLRGAVVGVFFAILGLWVYTKAKKNMILYV